MTDWITTEFNELTATQVYQLLELRQLVFCLEQNCLYTDIDGLDRQASHLMLYQGHSLIAYLRSLPPGIPYSKYSSIGRVVVHPDYRGQQLGRELMKRGIRHTLQQYSGYNICISAQLHLSDFYRSLGFQSEGQPYQEDGIAHIKMLLNQR